MKMTIGERLKEVRHILGFSQENLAKILRVNRSFLALIETKIRKPSEQTLFVLEKEVGISKNWLETGQGLIFSDYKKGLTKIKEKINLNETLSKYEIEFILSLIQLSWSIGGSLPANPVFVKNLISIFEYVYKNCKIKNINSLVGDKHFVDFITNPNIPKTVKDSEMYIARELVVLFRDGEFELSKKDCETISSHLLPWGYYVGLSYVNREKEKKISSIYLGNLDFISEVIDLEDSDIPAVINEENFGFYIITSVKKLMEGFRKQDETYSGGFSIELKQKQIYIHMTLFDLVEFLLLIKTIPELKKNQEHRVGEFVLNLSPNTDFPYSLTKVCRGFIVVINFTEEQFNALRKIVQHIDRYEKFAKFAFKWYVEKYGFI